MVWELRFGKGWVRYYCFSGMFKKYYKNRYLISFKNIRRNFKDIEFNFIK